MVEIDPARMDLARERELDDFAALGVRSQPPDERETKRISPELDIDGWGGATQEMEEAWDYAVA